MKDLISYSLSQGWPVISNQVNVKQIQTILQQLEKILTSDLEGAVVEFGCYIGTTSLFIQRLLNAYADTREFHVYDSFVGLPPKSSQDESRAGEQFKAGELAVSKKQFIREFQKANLQTPIIHKGWFSDLQAHEIPNHVAFAFLDGDFYESIRDSLRLVLPRMQVGGILVIDDYSREALPGVAKAVYQLLTNRPIIVAHDLGIIQL